MIVTEEEAKTKWCPESRTGMYAGSGGVAVNRHCADEVRDETRCIGSACMAWRFIYPSAPTALATPLKGYCGKAGEPLR